MKKSIPAIVILFLWATMLSASDRPPYADTHALNPFFLYQESQFNQQGLEMYPNPMTDGTLTIKSEEAFYSIQILNTTGKIVYNQEFPSGSNLETLELSKLEKGMYLVRTIFSNSINHTGKLIVK